MINRAKISLTLLGTFLSFSILVKAENHFFFINNFKQNSTNDIQPIEKLIQDGKWIEAYSEANKIISADPKSVRALFVRTLAPQILFNGYKAGEVLSIYSYPFSDYVASQNLKHWIDSLSNADNSNINFLYLEAAYRIFADQNFKQAITIFEKILQLDSVNIFALATIGGLYGGSNQLEDAIRVTEMTIKLKPDCPSAYTNLGMVEMSKKDYIKAEQYFKQATSFKSASPSDWFNLGSLYYFQKKYQAARVALDKAVLFSPDNVEAQYNLAGICYYLNDASASIKHLKIVVKVGYNSPFYAKAKQNLRQLGAE